MRIISLGTLGAALVLLLAGMVQGQASVFDRKPPGGMPLNFSRSRLYPGIYAFYDWDNLSPVEYPWLVGGVLIRRWNQISTGPDSLDWSEIETWTGREARVGKRAILRLSPHDGWDRGRNLDGTPDWVYAEGVTRVRLSDGAVYPQYWHPVYRARLREFIAALGAKYDGDSRVEAVELGIGLYGEAFPGPDDPAWTQSGLTDSVWEAYVKEIIDDYAATFVETPLILMEQMYPQGNFRQMGRITDHAAQKGINIGFNGLRPEDESAWSDQISSSEPGWHSPFEKWVMSGLRLGRFEAHHELRRPELVYWAILNGLDSNATYLSLYQVDVTNSQNREAFEFAQKYLGKTIGNTSGVWIALREETPDLRLTKPGNYGMGLLQYEPDNTSLGLRDIGGKEGLFARRTRQASGRRYLAFGLDDRFLYQNSGDVVEVTVTYLDQGVDTWELQYDAVDNPYQEAGVVEKGDSGTWKKWSRTLADAYFGNRQEGGNDLRLYSRHDGDDTFHMIEVTKLPSVSKQLWSSTRDSAEN